VAVREAGQQEMDSTMFSDLTEEEMDLPEHARALAGRVRHGDSG
jgi:hypothetical protein